MPVALFASSPTIFLSVFPFFGYLNVFFFKYIISLFFNDRSPFKASFNSGKNRWRSLSRVVKVGLNGDSC